MKKELIMVVGAGIGIIAAALFIVYGSYLPFVKAQRFIVAFRAMSSIKSVQEFEANFDRVFNFYSPVGSEEIAKFLSGDVANLISQEGQSEEVSRLLVAYIEPHMFKNNVRHLLSLGQMYAALWANHGKKEEDFQKAERYFLDAYAIGPKLPPVLYSLLQIYTARGDQEKAADIARQILTYWPTEDKIKVNE